MQEAGARKVQPPLIPIKGDHLKAQTNKGYQARFDIAATGIWNNSKRNYLDVRVTHPRASKLYT